MARGDFAGARELIQGFYGGGEAPGPDYAEADQTASGFLTSRAGAEKAEAVSGGKEAGGLAIPKAAEPYMGLVDAAAAEYDVPPGMILAVMKGESAFRAGAV